MTWTPSPVRDGSDAAAGSGMGGIQKVRVSSDGDGAGEFGLQASKDGSASAKEDKDDVAREPSFVPMDVDEPYKPPPRVCAEPNAK